MVIKDSVSNLVKWCTAIGWLCGSFYTGLVMAIEEPVYSIIEKSGDLELRAYEPRIVAQTTVLGSMDNASKVGFRRIADYIFGDNTATGGRQKKISMTTPVILQPHSEKISMTEPTSLEQADGQWRIKFIMPGTYTSETLPEPNNSAVTLHEMAAGNYAAIRFSGLANEMETAKRTATLMNWLNRRGINPIGRPLLARYDSPWTLPFLRRNEILVAY